MQQLMSKYKNMPYNMRLFFLLDLKKISFQMIKEICEHFYYIHYQWKHFRKR